MDGMSWSVYFQYSTCFCDLVLIYWDKAIQYKVPEFIYIGLKKIDDPDCIRALFVRTPASQSQFSSKRMSADVQHQNPKPPTKQTKEKIRPKTPPLIIVNEKTDQAYQRADFLGEVHLI